MITPELIKYVENEIASGVGLGDLKQKLIITGWASSDVDEAFLEIQNKKTTPVQGGSKSLLKIVGFTFLGLVVLAGTGLAYFKYFNKVKPITENAEVVQPIDSNTAAPKTPGEEVDTVTGFNLNVPLGPDGVVSGSVTTQKVPKFSDQQMKDFEAAFYDYCLKKDSFVSDEIAKAELGKILSRILKGDYSSPMAIVSILMHPQVGEVYEKVYDTKTNTCIKPNITSAASLSDLETTRKNFVSALRSGDVKKASMFFHPQAQERIYTGMTSNPNSKVLMGQLADTTATAKLIKSDLTSAEYQSTNAVFSFIKINGTWYLDTK